MSGILQYCLNTDSTVAATLRPKLQLSVLTECAKDDEIKINNDNNETQHDNEINSSPCVLDLSFSQTSTQKSTTCNGGSEEQEFLGDEEVNAATNSKNSDSGYLQTNGFSDFQDRIQLKFNRYIHFPLVICTEKGLRLTTIYSIALESPLDPPARR